MMCNKSELKRPVRTRGLLRFRLAILVTGLFASGSYAQILDCNGNNIPDLCDISNSTCLELCEDFSGACTLPDNNGNAIPDECELECDNFDVVFVVDTSGSIQDEGAVLCNNINQIVAELGALGLPLNATLLGILDNPPGSSFGCLTGSVLGLFGSDVPGTPPACCPTMSQNEDWAAATAIVADRFAWQPDAVRVIIPISDEGPQNGDPCDDPGFDRASITNAINIASANNVLVAPITGNGSNACTVQLAADLADGTGGAAFASTDPSTDLVNAIGAILIGLCRSGPVAAPLQLDLCPGDPDKIDPGVCGCGVPDADNNADGITDCIESAGTNVSSDPACSLCGTVGVAFYCVTLTAYALLLFTRRRRR